MLVLHFFSAGDACFCQFLQMMMAFVFNAGSARGFLLGMLVSASVC